MERPSRHEVNRDIRAFFDERAVGWDEMVCAEHADRLGGIVAALDIAPGSRVLDVGAGNGVLLPFLATEAGFVVELDLSYRMLVEAKSRATRQRAGFLQADVLDLPLARACLDLIICNSCFPHFCDQRRAVAEMARCLDADGRLVICHTQSRERINEHHRHVGGTVGSHELPTGPRMRAFMRDAGLVVSELVDGPEGYRVVCVKP